MLLVSGFCPLKSLQIDRSFAVFEAETDAPLYPTWEPVPVLLSLSSYEAIPNFIHCVKLENIDERVVIFCLRIEGSWKGGIPIFWLRHQIFAAWFKSVNKFRQRQNAKVKINIYFFQLTKASASFPMQTATFHLLNLEL